MTDEELKAYNWALSQPFPSVAARYARILAKYIERLKNNTSFDQIDIPKEVFLSPEAKRCGFTQRSFLEAGWRKLN